MEFIQGSGVSDSGRGTIRAAVVEKSAADAADRAGLIRNLRGPASNFLRLPEPHESSSVGRLAKSSGAWRKAAGIRSKRSDERS